MIKVYFVHNDKDILESMLPALPRYGDLVFIDRWGEGPVRYIVLGCSWVFDKNEPTYVKVELSERK